MFTVILTEKAQIDFAIFKKNNPKGYKTHQGAADANKKGAGQPPKEKFQR